MTSRKSDNPMAYSSFYHDKMKVLTNEFHGKITHDFQCYVFLGLSKETKKLSQVLNMAVSRDGFQAYKAVHYKNDKILHFYIRFENRGCAEKAVVFFRASDEVFIAEIVTNILLTWYILEMTQSELMAWTTAFVDVEGRSDYQISTIQLGKALRPYGYHRMPSIRQKFPSSVKVLFPSFAEALAANIALGNWLMEGAIPVSSTIYRVRIVSSNKEEKLFISCGSCPFEAFQLDYFLSPNAKELADSEAEYSYEAPKREISNKERRAYLLKQ